MLTAAGVPAGPVNTLDQAFALAERLGLDPVEENDGVRTVRFPVELSQTPARTRPLVPCFPRRARAFDRREPRSGRGSGRGRRLCLAMGETHA